MLQNNLIAEILDSKKRYSLEDLDNRRVHKKPIGQIPVLTSASIMTNSLMAYDADVLYSVSVPTVSLLCDAKVYVEIICLHQ